MKKHLTQKQKTEFKYILELVSSSINSTEPPKPYADIDWKSILKIAKFSGLGAICTNAVLAISSDNIPSQVIQYCQKISRNELVLDTNQLFEVEKLLKAFDKYKIKNCPVKGYFMKQEYPRSDFRSISDFDILFDRKDEALVKQAFSELGYDFDHSDDNQYHFKKSPCMYVEMHATLVHEFESYYKYLYDQLDRTIKREGYEFSYQMSYEDHYVYLLVHSSNHLRIAGLGVRMVLDTYVYYKNHRSDFDMDYLKKRLEEFGLTEFENRLRKIAFNWFGKPEPEISFDDFETFILLSGRLGRVDVAIMRGSSESIKRNAKNGKRKTKLSYFLSVVFPKKSEMQIHYPYLEKAPFLLPVSWISRLFKRAFIEKNIDTKRTLNNHFSYNEEDVKFYNNILKEVGFDSSFGK